MEKKLVERTLGEAQMIIKTKKTLRCLAEELNIGKSTIHKDMHLRLKTIDKTLYEEVQKVFMDHIKTRHLRGGESTKKKYKKNQIK